MSWRRRFLHFYKIADGVCMTDNEFAQIIGLITKSIGIIPRDSHVTGIRNYIEKRSEELSCGKSFSSFYNSLLSDKEEMVRLINSATVNETYFFREEAQFLLLKNKIFPDFVQRCGRNIKIWSAAASSGEEIYSLFLLAESMGLNASCIASDINTDVLLKCEGGRYKKNAIRAGDGAKFHPLLEKYKNDDGSFTISNDICSKIVRKRINLSKLCDFPEGQDIIFIRNVFIYFSAEMKKKILMKVVSESLAPGGYLFVSMNEVAGLDKSIIPEGLEKISDGNVFYFRKGPQEDIWQKT